MKCAECKGKGYQEKAISSDYSVDTVKVWCERCKGRGNLKYEGDRTDISWERE